MAGASRLWSNLGSVLADRMLIERWTSGADRLARKTWKHIRKNLVGDGTLEMANIIYRIQFPKVAYIGCSSQTLANRLWNRKARTGHLLQGPVRQYLQKGHKITEVKVLNIEPKHSKRFWKERFYIG